MTVQLTPTLCGQWFLKGRQPLVPCLAKTNQKVHLFGALNPISGKLHYRQTDTINTHHFQGFLKHLLSYYSRDLLLFILDGASWHRSKAVELLLQQNPRLILFPLPPYSPEMNPQEWVWKQLRKEVTHNYFFEILPKLKTALRYFFIKRQNQGAQQKLIDLCHNLC